MLRYFLFMGRLSRRAQWGLVIGAYFAAQYLNGLARTHPRWQPWIQPLLIAYFVFVVMTWISQPLFNLLLRLSPYGRHALSDDQRRGANVVGLLAFPALVCLVGWVTGFIPSYLALLGAIYFGLLLLPASAIFKCDAGWPRWGMAAYTLLLASLIPTGIVLAFLRIQILPLVFQGHVYGCALSGLVANVLLMQRAKRYTVRG
jgi:hypothetical protein